MTTARHSIRALRREQSLSQRELARLASVDHSYLSRYEAGALESEPSDRWLRDVSAALGVNLVHLQRRSEAS